MMVERDGSENLTLWCYYSATIEYEEEEPNISLKLSNK